MSDMQPAPDQAPDQSQAPDDQGGSEKTVCIECSTDANGNMTYSVGLEPEGQESQGGDEEAQEAQWMSPARSLDDALRVAKDLLTSDQASDAESGDAFQAGWEKQGGPSGIDALNTRGMK